MRGVSELSPMVHAPVTAPTRGEVALRSRLLDYLELTKPRLTSLVLFTVAAGFLLGSNGSISIGSFGVTLLGVFLVTAAGAALNQVLEGPIDRKMDRTRNRPVAVGRMPRSEAVAFGIGCGLGGVTLLFTINPLTATLAVGTLAFYVLIYTPLKQRSELNTLVGAVAGALPPLMGWAAASGTLTLQAGLLFLIQYLWQVPHFLAIAWLYREDYRRGGLKMLSVEDPDGTRTMRQIRLFSLVLFPVSLLPAVTGLVGPLYFYFAVVPGLLFLGVGIATAVVRTRSAARWLFLASVAYLPTLYGLMLIDKLAL